MNPYRLFVMVAVRAAVLAFRKMSPGAKLLWLYLADTSYIKGFDWHSQANMAIALGISHRQLKRHLARLVKLKLVHIHHHEGKQNRTWLLYHPLFASCSPMGGDTSGLAAGSDMSQALGQIWPTQRIVRRKEDQTRSGDASRVPTSGGAVARNGQKTRPPESPNGSSNQVPITDRLSTPQVFLNQLPGWYSLNETERRNRADGIYRLVAEITHYQKYLDDEDASIGRQARIEVAARMRELEKSGVLNTPNSRRRR